MHRVVAVISSIVDISLVAGTTSPRSWRLQRLAPEQRDLLGLVEKRVKTNRKCCFTS